MLASCAHTIMPSCPSIASETIDSVSHLNANRCFNSLHFYLSSIALHCPALHCIVLPCTALSCLALHCPSSHCIVLCCPARQVTTTTEALGQVYAVLGRRRASVVKEEMQEGSGMFVVLAFLPVADSFGFAHELRDKTSGAASPQASVW